MIVNRNNTPRSRNMKSMLNLIAMAAELAGRAVPMPAMARNDEDRRSRSRTCWEETLICGMHDDTTRMLLDHFEPSRGHHVERGSAGAQFG